MGFRLTLSGDLDDDIRRIAREQIDRALEAVQDSNDGRGVHDARKRLKMLRALVRLVRDPLGPARYAAENQSYRTAGRRISAVRDADVLLSTLKGLTIELGREHQGAVRSIRTHLTRQRAEHRSALTETTAFVRTTLRDARGRIDRWPLESLSMGDLLDGFATSYERGRRAFHAAVADPEDEPMHEWRKRAKEFWYHLRLLRDAWPKVTEGWTAEAHRLTDLIGDDHDLAVLMQSITNLALDTTPVPNVDHVRSAIRERREQLQQQASVLGWRLYAEKPRPMRRRMRAYLRAWGREQALGTAEQLNESAA
jgi:CHAD domain-containing protein